jgi:hypothetical protein
VTVDAAAMIVVVVGLGFARAGGIEGRNGLAAVSDDIVVVIDLNQALRLSCSAFTSSAIMFCKFREIFCTSDWSTSAFSFVLTISLLTSVANFPSRMYSNNVGALSEGGVEGTSLNLIPGNMTRSAFWTVGA